jgi:hypothetical protein
MFLETGVDLFDIADTNTAASRRPKSVVAVKLEIDAVLEALPFFEGEELAEG